MPGVRRERKSANLDAKSEQVIQSETAPRKRKPYRHDFEVLEDIQRLILEGVFLVGAPLPTMGELEVMLGAHHATISKALHGLHKAGILEPNEGHKVTLSARLMLEAGVPVWFPGERAPTDEEILSYRKLFGPPAAFESTLRLRARPGDNRELVASFKALKDCLREQNNRHGARVMDRRFQAAVEDLCPNELLRRSLRTHRVYTLDHLSMSMMTMWMHDWFCSQMFALNERIFGCMMKRDAEGARAAMHVYLDYVAKEYFKAKKNMTVST